MSDRKTDILEAALDLMQTVGYASFSYADIASRLGMAKPTIHHHFPTKEDLGLAAVEQCLENFAAIRAQVTARGPGPAEEFRSMLSVTEEEIRDKGRLICPIGALQTDLESLPPLLREAAARLDGQLHSWLSELLERGVETGEMHLEASPKEAAWLLMSAVQGGRQNARAHGIEVWQILSRQLEALILTESRP